MGFMGQKTQPGNQRYINLNPGRLFIQQPPKTRKGSEYDNSTTSNEHLQSHTDNHIQTTNTKLPSVLMKWFNTEHKVDISMCG